MAIERPIEQVREGMKVVSSDGVEMGAVARVHRGTEPTDRLAACEDETCVEVRRESLGREIANYIPCRALAGVVGDTVRLDVDLETATTKGWATWPAWLG